MNFESTSLAALLIIPIVLSLVTAALTSLGTFYVQERKLKADLRTEFMAEAAVRRLLQSDKYSKRNFDTLQMRVGGFTDDELRKILVRAGAVRFSKRQGHGELWGLIERNRSDLEGSDNDEFLADT